MEQYSALDFFRRGGTGVGDGRIRDCGVYTCMFIHNTPRIQSQTNPTQAPAIHVCAGSFISSATSRPPLPFCFWKGFKTFIITTVTTEWRACESGEQLVFFPCSSPHVWHHEAFVFFIHTPTDNATLHSRVWWGRPCCQQLASVFVSWCWGGKVVRIPLLV